MLKASATKLLGLSLIAAAALAQNPKIDLKAEEAAIRSLIQTNRNPPFAQKNVRWSGAYKRPVQSPDKGELFKEDSIQKRKNQKSSTKVERIEVAAAGDMAWEFSTGTLEFDLEGSSEHLKFETGTLRVWKKEDGQWKVAASFIRPLDLPFADR
jgi:hypothetical protein